MTPVKAMEIYHRHGIEISIEEAKLILDLMYKISKLTIEILIENENS